MRFLMILAAFVMGSGAASAASMDAPKRKSGLWEIRMSNPHMQGGQTMQQCVDQKSDDLMSNKMHQEKMSCTKSDVHTEGDKIVAESVCKMEGTTAKTRAVFSGKFDSAYKADIKSTYDPPMHGMRESSTTIEAKWLSPCLPGQKPGDIMPPGMPGGMNMEEMMKKGKK